LQIQSLLRQAVQWRFGGFSKLRRVLDFAAGDGRATRFLAAEVGPDRVWASDILPAAVEFQGKEFGVRTIQPVTDPDQFRCGETFDCILVSSLFTRLPEGMFARWLRVLFGLLAPGGVLVFSVHGEALLPQRVSMPLNGIWFHPGSEDSPLKSSDYGSAIVTDGFVRRQIGKLPGPCHGVSIERGLCRQQDVYILSNQAVPAKAPQIVQEPDGFVDLCLWTKSKELVLGGWAADVNAGHSIKEVQIFINGKLCGVTKNSIERPDIANHLKGAVGESRAAGFLRTGWKCTIATHEEVRPFSDLLLAKAVSTSGAEFVLRSGKLDTMLQIAQRS